jgi:ERF superfamily
MNTSPTIGQLAQALASAQLEFAAVVKDSDNPYYSSKYADLSTVIGATQPALAKNGLVIIQSPVVRLEDQKAGVVTTLAHKSGEWMSDELILPATMKGKDGTFRFDAQSVGSAITYARRYTYQSMIGVAAEVDDDGNKASGVETNGHANGHSQTGTVEAAQAVAAKKIAAAGVAQKMVLCKEMGDGNVSLSGDGISTILVALGEAGKAKLEMTWLGVPYGWVIPMRSSFGLEDACRANGVGMSYVPTPEKDAPPPPADAPSTNGALPLGHGKISNTEMAEGKKGPFMRVWQSGNKMQVFENHQMKLADGSTIALFTLLKTAKGQEAIFQVNKTKGDYLNIVGVAKLGRLTWDEAGNPL